MNLLALKSFPKSSDALYIQLQQCNFEEVICVSEGASGIGIVSLCFPQQFVSITHYLVNRQNSIWSGTFNQVKKEVRKFTNSIIFSNILNISSEVAADSLHVTTVWMHEYASEKDPGNSIYRLLLKWVKYQIPEKKQNLVSASLYQ